MQDWILLANILILCGEYLLTDIIKWILVFSLCSRYQKLLMLISTLVGGGGGCMLAYFTHPAGYTQIVTV